MAKKKVAKKAVKKVSASPKKAASAKSQGFFDKHKNLRWLLPLLLGVLAVSLLVHHYVDESQDISKVNPVKDRVVNTILNHKANDADKDDDTITVTPTPTPVAY